MKRYCLGVLAAISAQALLVTPSFAGETVNYTYDALGRLVTASSSGSVNNEKNQSITYDAAGNRTNFSLTDPSSGPANLSIGNASATEGSNLSFTVTRSGNTSTAVSVQYATASGTAVSGSDFTAKSGTLSFASSETSKTVVVATINDTVSEPTETMTLTLSGASSGASITTAAGTGTIIDNDSGWASLLTVGETTMMIDLGIYGTIPITYKGYMNFVIGSMSNTSYNSNSIVILDTSGAILQFAMTASATPANSGWNSITVPGLGTFTRASGSYSASSSTQATWTWSVTSGTIANGTVTIQ